MNKEDIQKLIGGYATGSLTDDERHALFEAALDDQELFDTLQQEQPLKDLFDDPFSREQVRRAAAEGLPRQPRTSWFRRPAWFHRPWIWASAASAALAGVLVVALVRWDTPQSQAVKQPEVAANKQQPAPEQTPLPDREKSASEPSAPKPRAVAGKSSGGIVKTPTLDDKRSFDSKDPAAGRKDDALETRRSPAAGLRRGEGFGRATTSADRPGTSPVELSKNRERDLRDSVNGMKNGEGGGAGGPSRVNSAAPAPVNSAETLRNFKESPRNTEESPRNTAETPRNPAEAPRNTVELPKKDNQVAALPPPSSQSQLERGRQSGPSQIQQPQQVQAPPPAPEISYRAQTGRISTATGTPNPTSQPRDSEGKLSRATTLKTESTDEMMKAKTANSPKSKAAGSSPTLAKKAALAKASSYSLARRSEDGSYVGVSTKTVFQPGETVRVTIVPSVAGPVSIEESDATNRVWRLVYPADSDKSGVAEKETSAVPVDVVVEKNQRLRVKIGSEMSYIITIRAEAAAARGRAVK
jgi:hypothetical protein